MRHILQIIIILGFLYFSLYPVRAVSENVGGPYIDPGGGGVSSVKMLEDFFSILFGNKNSRSDIPMPTLPPGVTPTPDPNVPTATPGPAITYPPSNTDEARYADDVVNYAKNNCRSYKGSVTGDCSNNPLCGRDNSGSTFKKSIIDNQNYNCLDSFAPIMNAGARAELKYSAQSYVFAQCVSGVRSQSEARGRPYNAYGNAIDHARVNADPNYTYYTRSSDPQYARLVPGSIIIQDIGQWGHIMYVTEVNRDPSTQKADNVKVYELNYGYYLYGSVRHDRFLSVDNIKGWQTPNSL